MKIKIILIILLSSLCFFDGQAQWKKVLDLSSKKAGGTGSFFTLKSRLIVVTDIGTYLSIDSGITWKLIDSSLAMCAINRFVASDSIVFANTTAGIYFSTDSGSTWHITKSTPSTGINDIILSGNNLLACSKSKIYLSSDCGENWIVSNNGIPSKPPSSNGQLFPFSNIGKKTIVFYGHSSYMTNDNGANWNHVGDSCIVDMAILNLGHYLYSAQGSGNIYRSMDSSLTWHSILTPNPLCSTLFRMYTDQKNIIGALYEGGVIFSQDSGTNWIYINNGLPSANVDGVAILGNYVFCGLDKGLIFRRTLSEVTGVNVPEKSSEAFKLKVYPNPFLHTATFEFGIDLHNAQILIFDISGKEVLRTPNINSDKFILQRNGLAKGTYTYVLTEGNKQIATSKLQIQTQL